MNKHDFLKKYLFWSIYSFYKKILFIFTDNMESPIQKFYNGRTIFVTGSSGLMGKVLVEKLLFSCPNVEKIYMLIRPKRGKNASQRIEAIWQLPVIIK